jgi:short-subunit dehydrogenase
MPVVLVGWGRIVNLSSLAAMAPPGEGLLYTGIKTYVLNISQSLNMELKRYGIHVTALCPGFTHRVPRRDGHPRRRRPPA